ncbi:trehalase family glycosidase [Francisella persica]|uniref:trehalase family glycosidase n=1 Tax=Francisella persica TaxID=954 RepID=UPI002ADDE958|nr:trehalase family glycosidase [Francisella persica]
MPYILFLPNANIKYYLTRSQPPLLYFIVNILYQELNISAIEKYLPAIEKEYSFWINSKRNTNGWNDSYTHLACKKYKNWGFI